ncbi:bifunctional aspartate kinase/homoserine dehydrogenase I [Niabella drilacis]|uniref:Aspartate kinase n=1 Tax=Niabella drilacis (strain DSM 25811 / CCM 8410 / CCUG 62505 / LMG 26954 / E90) TaxID=1285928 RepID=A0A1G6T4U8_NIADE|nr:bifunctional aspartate kinase/homoserine dehydrogenase I [Niabella drilacis]SDD24011.1 aspartate kinase [Niabella drilacis]
MQVFKFGGSSVANAENIKKVAAIVDNAAKKNSIVVVVSALGGITDLLLTSGKEAAEGSEDFRAKISTVEQRHFETIKELIPIASQSSLLSLVKKTINEIEEICNGIFLLREITPRNQDRLAAYGEWLSSQIIAEALKHAGLLVLWKDARQFIFTNSDYTHAEVLLEATEKEVRKYFKENKSNVFVIPGFIGSDEQGVTTTLGRGGSDYTAALIAAAIDAESLQVWKDVNGMMTADPRLAINAKVIERISYSEAMELSHFGAKVLYPPTIQPVMSKNIPLYVKNTFAPEMPGTIVGGKAKGAKIVREHIVSGISSVNNIALLSLEGSGMIGIPGFSKRLFEALSKERINVVLITQSSSEHSICVAIEQKYLPAAKKVVDTTFADEIALKKVEPLKAETHLSIVALVGENMKSLPGVSGRMFGALGRNGINIRAIAQGSSEKNISTVIATDDVRKAINVLHEEFFETIQKQLNLFIVGLGNVGAKLMEQLKQQHTFLVQHLKLNVSVVGISNSRKMIFKERGVSLSGWKETLAGGEPASITDFANEIIKRNMRNSIFVDITANKEVAKVYERMLQKSISVVACNKIAAASPFAEYKKLKELAHVFNAKFLFETNVGAALPVIATLNDLRRSGDEIRRIEAVLSGTLNFVFNHYDGSRPFAEVVKQAQDEGYTEPDPRLDLSGMDVMRKILILARESGFEMEMEDIENHSFLPASCMEGSVDAFYKALEKEEAHFKGLLDAALAANSKLKFVATFNEGKASVGLQHVKPENDLYHLYGKDNVVLFYTGRYPEQPLVVKGAGAGADVTASGVFADIMRAVNE